ncbi:MAG: hypothetical protein GY778_26710 [bacterium]|nr:hypothetical protein [bacterium]
MQASNGLMMLIHGVPVLENVASARTVGTVLTVVGTAGFDDYRPTFDERGE